ncbi:outer dense fiber protein 3 isoform X2 [Schistocerca nitens]|uniref:outer dense fiber protein 3 isoform X2 n=1 Tax=Schistocerca nitens TaxID=7011 RepID=UPI00211907F9|nr:outer dense fiber protein 3 isoform X2 [Schistocerca nitens]
MGGITQRPWTPTKRRGPIAAEFSGPGPACVTLPNLIGGSAVPDSKRGRAPAFSFGSRHNSKNDSAGPGPGQYNVTGLSAKGKDSPPAATLHGRPKDPRHDNTPAPGDYNPEKSEKVVLDNSPKYTFGLKTQVEKPSTTPAPNVYNIPTVLGATKEGNKKQAPAFTISGRQKELTDDRILVPGPGTYNDARAENYKARSPAYSISSRYQLPSDSTQKPGPGAHSPEKVKLDALPNYSFGIKHSPYLGYLKGQMV